MIKRSDSCTSSTDESTYDDDDDDLKMKLDENNDDEEEEENQQPRNGDQISSSSNYSTGIEESTDDDDERKKQKKKMKKKNSSSSSSSSSGGGGGGGGGVRQYARSKLPRLRWTPDLHLRFVHSVHTLGGPHRATPKLVLQLMHIKGISIAHVKSHLQMYRSRKIDDQGRVIHNKRHLMGSTGGGDQHDLHQNPNQFHHILQGFNHLRHLTNSTFSGSWNWTNASMGGDHMNFRSRPGIYAPVVENTINRMSTGAERPSKWDFSVGKSALILEQASKTHHHHHHKPIEEYPLLYLGGVERLSCLNTTGIKWRNFGDERDVLKRKVSDSEPDLNLSLNVKSESREEYSKSGSEDEDIDSNLSLSLFSPSSKKQERYSMHLNKDSKLQSRKKAGEDDSSKENTRSWASTLDLTIGIL